MAVSRRLKPKKKTSHARHRSALPGVSLLTSIPTEKPSGWLFKRRRSSNTNKSAELNSSAFFFALLVGILVLFLALAFLGAYYFSLRSADDNKSQSSLRNMSIKLTQDAARYRANLNANSALNTNSNRQSACTSLTDRAICEARPDCTVEYTCDCDTAGMRADKCDYKLQPNESCVCGQSDFNRCIELVCPIDR